MNRYEITLLVPARRTVMAASVEEAAVEAHRLTAINNKDNSKLKTMLRSVLLVEKDPEPIDFGFTDGGDVA
jgi:hypothetical protein